jgi:hypothetical protein
LANADTTIGCESTLKFDSGSETETKGVCAPVVVWAALLFPVHNATSASLSARRSSPRVRDKPAEFAERQ